jgi:pimeloyl-ACP methyl ester carboxylesterase
MNTYLLQPGWRETMMPVNGVDLHVVDAGSPGAPLLVLLHGFPEFWWAWRKQITPLAEAGYHVVVPDMRGYNGSSAPADVSAYTLDILAADVVALAAAFGRDSFHLVGHDWGAAIAWWTAAHYPSRVEGAVVMDGPHPEVWSAQARKHPTQALKSAYVAGFQLPWLPEAALGAFDHAALKAIMQGSAHEDTFEPGALDRYRAAWAKPGALTAMLNYYRALRLHQRGEPPARLRPPTLILWGTEDRFLERHVMEAGLALCDDGRFVAIDGATHWLHLDQAARITDEIRGFFGRVQPDRPAG